MKQVHILFFVHTVHIWNSFNCKIILDQKHLLLNKQGSEESDQTPEEWFTQKLDHFNPTDGRTWKQRFFINAQYYNTSGKGVSKPIFLFIGGEEVAFPVWITQGAWIDYAKKYNALCFYIEHRYYGKSIPTEDMSLENLQYLTSQQALADLATFITAMKEKYQLPSKSKWIAFGGSYPGALAAWLRLKYPHLVHGAVSSSAPLEYQIDFSDFYRVVTESIATHSKKCIDIIKDGIIQIDRLLHSGKDGWKSLNNKLPLCDPIQESVINNPKDVANFFATLAGSIGGITQAERANVSFITHTSNILTIEKMCEIMENKQHNSPLDAIAAVISLPFNLTLQECLDYHYEKMINPQRNITWDVTQLPGDRQWSYQVCTEFGNFITSSNQGHVFGDYLPVEFGIQRCMDIFGPKFNSTFIKSAVDRTNLIYGGLNINATNIVYVHGTIDAWHARGLLKANNPEAPVIIINGTAHMADCFPEFKDDLPQLKAARREIVKYIGQWIEQ